MIKEEPTEKIFEDIKQAAIAVWNTFDDTYGYRSEKLERVDSIKNYSDNWFTFISMFDFQNQYKLLNNIKDIDTITFLREQRDTYGFVSP